MVHAKVRSGIPTRSFVPYRHFVCNPTRAMGSEGLSGDKDEAGETNSETRAICLSFPFDQICVVCQFKSDLRIVGNCIRG